MSDDREFKSSVLQELKSITSTITNMDRKFDLHIQETKFELTAIKKLDDQQNELIDEHIKGVNTLRGMYESLKEELDKRIEKLEEPKKWLGFNVNIIVKLGLLAGALAAIAGLFK